MTQSLSTFFQNCSADCWGKSAKLLGMDWNMAKSSYCNSSNFTKLALQQLSNPLY